MSGMGGRPALWAIHRDDDAAMWVIEQFVPFYLSDWGWRIRGEFPSGAEAIAAFARGGK